MDQIKTEKQELEERTQFEMGYLILHFTLLETLIYLHTLVGNMDKVEGKQRKRAEFCSCKNSCQKGTGRKRVGCPCKDQGVYCSDQCKCGTNVIVCRNNARCGVQSDNLPKNSSATALASKLSNMKVIDESDAFISDEEPPSKQGPSSTTMRSVVNDTSVIPSHLRKAQNQDRTQKVLPQSLLGQVHQINNGYALVFHNRYFHNLREREGSEKDLKAIKSFCKEAGLTIDVQENVKVKDIRAHCQKLTKNGNIFQNHDGLVCFILSHGNSSGVRGVYDETISVKEIVSFFKENDDLLGKPKLFFIQACRALDGQVEDDSTESNQQKRLCPPDSSDILVAHSTIKGELSFRDIRNGSWFIQTLMKQIKAYAQSSHLMDIMTVVNEDIAASELQGYRQMPIQVSTLTKFVYFKMATIPKGEEC